MSPHPANDAQPAPAAISAAAFPPGSLRQAEADPRHAEDLQQALHAREAAYQQLFAFVHDLQRVIRARDIALAEAKAAAQAKSVLLANMSHEFRTPLTAILGFAELLARRAKNTADRDLLARIHRAGQRVEGLVENLLTMTRLDSGTLSVQLAPCDLAEVLRGECARIADHARAKGLGFELVLPDFILETTIADEACLRQALAALLENAVKFTQTGRITVTLVADAESRLPLGIDVADTGIGIQPEHRARILAPFEQADSSSTRAADGAGLGLTVAHALLEGIGWQLDFASEPGKGSIFTIRLPETVPQTRSLPAA